MRYADRFDDDVLRLKIAVHKLSGMMPGELRFPEAEAGTFRCASFSLSI